jgi:hypothetical protein
MIASAGPTAPPGRLEQQHHADHRNHHVRRVRQARPQRNLAVKNQQIAGRADTQCGQQPVSDRDSIARRGFQCGKGGEGEQEGKRQMNDARLAVVDDAEIQLVGKRRSIPELEQGPAERDDENVRFGVAGWLSPAGVGFRDHGFERFALRHRLHAACHRVPLRHAIPKSQGDSSPPSPWPKATSSLFPCRT